LFILFPVFVYTIFSICFKSREDEQDRSLREALGKPRGAGLTGLMRYFLSPVALCRILQGATVTAVSRRKWLTNRKQTNVFEKC
jgi:hypothetical protein